MLAGQEGYMEKDTDRDLIDRSKLLKALETWSDKGIEICDFRMSPENYAANVAKLVTYLDIIAIINGLEGTDE